MSQRLAVEAVEIVKAHLARRGLASRISQAPLAHHRGRVTGLLHHLGKGRGTGEHRLLAFQRIVQEDGVPAQALRRNQPLVVGADLAVAHVLARHDAAARRGRQRGGRIHIGKHNTLRSQGIDVGGFNLFLAIAAQVAIAQIVEHQVDDVGLFGGFPASGSRAGRSRREEKEFIGFHI